jgi:hypothetical protein
MQIFRSTVRHVSRVVESSNRSQSTRIESKLSGNFSFPLSGC